MSSSTRRDRSPSSAGKRWTASEWEAGRLRAALESEAVALSALAFRSKAHWGYDADFMESCRGELTLTDEFLRDARVRVYESGSRILGFYSLVGLGSDLELAHFFVDPPAIGRGVGRAMWDDATLRTRELGHARLIVESDPFAEGFYLRLGAERIGETPSRVRPDRLLPLLIYEIGDHV